MLIIKSMHLIKLHFWTYLFFARLTQLQPNTMNLFKVLENLYMFYSEQMSKLKMQLILFY